jgi:hypothetical protein
MTRSRVLQQPHDAGLDDGFGEYGGDGVGEALQAIDDGQEDILFPVSVITVLRP